MTFAWWIGAALLLVCSVACGLNLGMRVAKGQDKAWSASVLGWAIGFQGLVGVVAVLMIVQAKG